MASPLESSCSAATAWKSHSVDDRAVLKPSATFSTPTHSPVHCLTRWCRNAWPRSRARISCHTGRTVFIRAGMAAIRPFKRREMIEQHMVHKTPLDIISVGTNYMNRYMDVTLDAANFSQSGMTDLVSRLHDAGQKFGPIVDSGTPDNGSLDAGHFSSRAAMGVRIMVRCRPAQRTSLISCTPRRKTTRPSSLPSCTISCNTTASESS